MPLTNSPVFPQGPRLATALCAAAVGNLTSDAPAGAVLLVTAGPNGSLLTSLQAMPRATPTANSLVLLHSADGGATMRLIDSEVMTGTTVNTTTAIAETQFPRYSESTPLRLGPNERLYVGTQVALAAGIVFKAEIADY